MGKLRGSDALLLTHEPTSSTTQGTKRPEDAVHPSNTKVEKILAELLEVGDIVRVPPGATPPADGTIVSLETTNFDERSLTGESRNVLKTTGDQVFVGTINKLRMVDIRVDAIEGETMQVNHSSFFVLFFSDDIYRLAQVIEAVLQGQTTRAPIERIVDVVTAYFVPVATTLAILTWIIWLSLGLSGALPADTLENTVGGWRTSSSKDLNLADHDYNSHLVSRICDIRVRYCMSLRHRSGSSDSIAGRLWTCCEVRYSGSRRW